MDKKYYIYCRKSTDEKDRQVLSISAQLSITRELAKRHGLCVAVELTESQSAKVPGRPIFNKMIKAIEDGEVCGVLAHKPDRLSRNDTDSAKIFELMSSGIEFVFADTPVMNNAMGRANLGMQFVWAKYYSENLSEEVRKGLREKFRQGLWPTYAPPGYLNKAGKVIVDQQRACFVKKAFQWFAEDNLSVKSLAQKLYEDGLRTKGGNKITKSVIHRILLNPFYYGMMEWGSMRVMGKHKPLVSKDLWQKAQNILHERSRPHPVSYDFTYRGMIRCGECGCGITAQYAKRKYVYYRCSKSKHKGCSQPYIREEELTAQLADIISGITIDEQTKEIMKKELKQARQSIDAYREQLLSSLKQRYAKLETRKESLWNIRLEDQMPQDVFRGKLDATVAEQEEIQAKIDEHERANNRWYDQCSNFLEMAGEAYLLYKLGEQAQKRKIVNSVCSNLVLKGGKLGFSYKKPFDILVKGEGRPTRRGRWDALRTFFMLNHWECDIQLHI